MKNVDEQERVYDLPDDVTGGYQHVRECRTTGYSWGESVPRDKTERDDSPVMGAVEPALNSPGDE